MNERSGQTWLESRYSCVTGTDIDKIMGCDYRCSRSKLLELKLLKKDPLENADEFTKMLLKLGNEFEPAALSAFQLAFRKRKLIFNGYVPGMTPHPNFTWFTGTPLHNGPQWI